MILYAEKSYHSSCKFKAVHGILQGCRQICLKCIPFRPPESKYPSAKFIFLKLSSLLSAIKKNDLLIFPPLHWACSSLAGHLSSVFFISSYNPHLVAWPWDLCHWPATYINVFLAETFPSTIFQTEVHAFYTLW